MFISWFPQFWISKFRTPFFLIGLKIVLKFIYSEKATKFCEISPLLLSVCTVHKSKVDILQNFVAFSEYTNFKGQLISKCFLEKIVWTKIATKKFDNFCPGGHIKKIKALSYINYGLFNVIKCLYFLAWPLFRC